jgi:putative ABC transport system permease protein
MFEYFLKMAGQFIDDMRKQKLRSVLTMSGITWGTMSVILLLAFGKSLQEASMKNMTGMGNNIVIMGGGRTSITYNGIPAGRWIRLQEESATLLRENIPEMGLLSPEIASYLPLNIGKVRQNTQCVGVNPEYGEMRNLFPEPGGRFIDRYDMENRRRVVFIGTDVRDKFFGKKANPVGKSIAIRGIPYIVIGVMEHKTQNSSYMSQDRGLVFLPFSTFKEMLGVTSIERIICRARDAVETPRLKAQVYAILGKTLEFSPDDKIALWMWDTSEMTRFLHYFFLGFEGFLLLGGVFTLVVGGIGVANIMYVTIRERRREIGIKSALGATPRMILAQFLLESFLIMLVGGGLGVLGALLIVNVMGLPVFAGIQKVLGVPSIDLTTSLITASLLALIGFAAGWSPAKSAAEMDPVKALES